VKVKARLQGMGGGESFSIQATCDSSNLFLFDISVTPEELGRLVLCQGFEKEIEFINPEMAHKIGLHRQNKTETVTVVAERFPATPDEIRRAVAEFEVDGWKGNDKDCLNHHRGVRGVKDAYIVSYTRLVGGT